MNARSYRIVPAALCLFFYACSSSPPSTAEEYVEQGDRQLSQGRIAEAIASYRLALYRDTLNPVVLSRLSKAYAERGNELAAYRYLRRAVNITYGEGRKALEEGDEKAAVAAFEKTLEIQPSHPLALKRLGDIYLARGQEDRALHLYEKSVEAQPEFVEPLVKIGQIYLSRGKLEEARTAFEKALSIDLNAFQAYLGLGEISLREEKWPEAADNFNKALIVQPRSPAAREGLEEARRHL